MRWEGYGPYTGRWLRDGTHLLAAAWRDGYWRTYDLSGRATQDGLASPPTVEAAQAAAEAELWARAAEGLVGL